MQILDEVADTLLSTWRKDGEVPPQASGSPVQGVPVTVCEDVRQALKESSPANQDTRVMSLEHVGGLADSAISPASRLMWKDRCQQIFRCQQDPRHQAGALPHLLITGNLAGNPEREKTFPDSRY